MSTRTAFYAGSFDPVTNGHVDVLRHAAKMADRLVIGIGLNPNKSPLFSTQERIDMLREASSHIKNCAIEIITFDDLLVKAAKRHGAHIIIRGLRDGTDFDYEMQMSGMNAVMEPDIVTVFVPASPIVRPITATLVRQIASMNGDVSGFVPLSTLRRLELKFSNTAKQEI